MTGTLVISEWVHHNPSADWINMEIMFGSFLQVTSLKHSYHLAMCNGTDLHNEADMWSSNNNDYLYVI